MKLVTAYAKQRDHNYLYGLCRILKWTSAQCIRRLGITIYTFNTLIPKRRKTIPVPLLLVIEALTGVNAMDILTKRDTLTVGNELKQKILKNNPGLKRTDWSYTKADYEMHCKLSQTGTEHATIAWLQMLVQLLAETMLLAERAEQRFGCSMVTLVWMRIRDQINETSELFDLSRYKDQLAEDSEWTESEYGFRSRLNDAVWIAYFGSRKCARYENALEAVKSLFHYENFIKSWKHKDAESVPLTAEVKTP